MTSDSAMRLDSMSSGVASAQACPSTALARSSEGGVNDSDHLTLLGKQHQAAAALPSAQPLDDVQQQLDHSLGAAAPSSCNAAAVPGQADHSSDHHRSHVRRSHTWTSSADFDHHYQQQETPQLAAPPPLNNSSNAGPDNTLASTLAATLLTTAQWTHWPGSTPGTPQGVLPLVTSPALSLIMPNTAVPALKHHPASAVTPAPLPAAATAEAPPLTAQSLRQQLHRQQPRSPQLVRAGQAISAQPWLATAAPLPTCKPGSVGVMLARTHRPPPVIQEVPAVAAAAAATVSEGVGQQASGLQPIAAAAAALSSRPHPQDQQHSSVTAMRQKQQQEAQTMASMSGDLSAPSPPPAATAPDAADRFSLLLLAAQHAQHQHRQKQQAAKAATVRRTFTTGSVPRLVGTAADSAASGGGGCCCCCGGGGSGGELMGQTHGSAPAGSKALEAEAPPAVAGGIALCRSAPAVLQSPTPQQLPLPTPAAVAAAAPQVASGDLRELSDDFKAIRSVLAARRVNAKRGAISMRGRLRGWMSSSRGAAAAAQRQRPAAPAASSSKRPLPVNNDSAAVEPDNREGSSNKRLKATRSAAGAEQAAAEGTGIDVMQVDDAVVRRSTTGLAFDALMDLLGGGDGGSQNVAAKPSWMDSDALTEQITTAAAPAGGAEQAPLPAAAAAAPALATGPPHAASVHANPPGATAALHRRMSSFSRNLLTFIGSRPTSPGAAAAAVNGHAVQHAAAAAVSGQPSVPVTAVAAVDTTMLPDLQQLQQGGEACDPTAAAAPAAGPSALDVAGLAAELKAQLEQGKQKQLASMQQQQQQHSRQQQGRQQDAHHVGLSQRSSVTPHQHGAIHANLLADGAAANTGSTWSAAAAQPAPAAALDDLDTPFAAALVNRASNSPFKPMAAAAAMAAVPEAPSVTAAAAGVVAAGHVASSPTVMNTSLPPIAPLVLGSPAKAAAAAVAAAAAAQQVNGPNDSSNIFASDGLQSLLAGLSANSGSANASDFASFRQLLSSGEVVRQPPAHQNTVVPALTTTAAAGLSIAGPITTGTAAPAAAGPVSNTAAADAAAPAVRRADTTSWDEVLAGLQLPGSNSLLMSYSRRQQQQQQQLAANAASAARDKDRQLDLQQQQQLQQQQLAVPTEVCAALVKARVLLAAKGGVQSEHDLRSDQGARSELRSEINVQGRSTVVSRTLARDQPDQRMSADLLLPQLQPPATPPPPVAAAVAGNLCGTLPPTLQQQRQQSGESGIRRVQKVAKRMLLRKLRTCCDRVLWELLGPPTPAPPAAAAAAAAVMAVPQVNGANQLSRSGARQSPFQCTQAVAAGLSMHWQQQQQCRQPASIAPQQQGSGSGTSGWPSGQVAGTATTAAAAAASASSTASQAPSAAAPDNSTAETAAIGSHTAADHAYGTVPAAAAAPRLVTTLGAPAPSSSPADQASRSVVGYAPPTAATFAARQALTDVMIKCAQVLDNLNVGQPQSVFSGVYPLQQQQQQQQHQLMSRSAVVGPTLQAAAPLSCRPDHQGQQQHDTDASVLVARGLLLQSVTHGVLTPNRVVHQTDVAQLPAVDTATAPGTLAFLDVQRPPVPPPALGHSSMPSPLAAAGDGGKPAAQQQRQQQRQESGQCALPSSTGLALALLRDRANRHQHQQQQQQEQAMHSVVSGGVPAPGRVVESGAVGQLHLPSHVVETPAAPPQQQQQHADATTTHLTSGQSGENGCLTCSATWPGANTAVAAAGAHSAAPVSCSFKALLQDAMMPSSDTGDQPAPGTTTDVWARITANNGLPTTPTPLAAAGGGGRAAMRFPSGLDAGISAAVQQLLQPGGGDGPLKPPSLVHNDAFTPWQPQHEEQQEQQVIGLPSPPLLPVQGTPAAALAGQLGWSLAGAMTPRFPPTPATASAAPYLLQQQPVAPPKQRVRRKSSRGHKRGPADDAAAAANSQQQLVAALQQHMVRGGGGVDQGDLQRLERLQRLIQEHNKHIQQQQ